MASLDERGLVDDGTNNLIVKGATNLIGPVTIASQNVADLTTLAGLDDGGLADYSSAFVASNQAYWILDKTSVATVDNVTVRSTRSGSGRWIRDLRSFAPHWVLRTAWYLDPLTGNDENDGGTSSTALLTLREVARRLNNGMPRNLVTLNVMNNITDANDYLALETNVNSQGTLGPTATALAGTAGLNGSNIYLRILGQRVTATFTDPNTASTTALTMTSNCLAPDNTQGTVGTSGASGLPTILTVSGFDFSSHLGKNIEVLTSNQANAIGAIGTIVAAPSTGVAWLQPLVKLSADSASSVGAIQVNLADYPTSGSTFRIYTNTTWAPNAHMGTIGAAGTSFIAVRNIEFTSSSTLTINRSQQMIYEGCTLKRPMGTSGGGEGSVQWIMLGTSIVFPDPTGGRTPTQFVVGTSGEVRFGCCAFLNVDVRLREAKASATFANCLFNRSCIMAGGPNDAGRMGSVLGLFTLPPASGLGAGGSDFGTGFYDWPAPDALAPTGTTRGSSGAAIHFGHGTKAVFTTKLYGYNATSGSVGVIVQEGAHLMVSEACTYLASASNPASPNPPYILGSLRLTGQAGDIRLDATGSHMPDSYYRQFLAGERSGSGANFVSLSSWKSWEDAPFSKNAKGTKTGACIYSILI